MTTITATDLVLRESISCKAKQVYTYLAHRSNKENTCFPGLKRIAKECGMSISSVQRALNILVTEGLLKKLARHRHDGSQTTNLYVLIEQVEERFEAQKKAAEAKIEKLEAAQKTATEKQLKIDGLKYESKSEKDIKADQTMERQVDCTDTPIFNQDQLLHREKECPPVGKTNTALKKANVELLKLKIKSLNIKLKTIKTIKQYLKNRNGNGYF